MRLSVAKLVVASVSIVVFPGAVARAQSDERTSFDDQLDQWIDGLADASPAVRRRFDKLRQIPEWRMTLPRTVRMLKAATRKFPPLFDAKSEPDWNAVAPVEDASGLLVYFVADRARPEHIAIIKECFAKYPPAARSQAMRLLSALKSRESAEAAMKFVREYVPRNELPMLYLWGWGEAPDCATIFFPEILRLAAAPALQQEALYLLETYTESPDVPMDLMERCGPELLEHYRRHEKMVRGVLRTGGARAIYSEDYVAQRDPLCQLLGLLALCPLDDARIELQRAVELRDLRIKLSAAVGLLRQGGEVSGRIWEEIADSAETRASLFDELSERERLSLFPPKHITQAALAESDLVRWLVSGSEMGRPPSKVELVKVVTVDPRTAEGMLDFYVFQFCMGYPADGKPPEWKAGVAGPYPRHEQPTATAHDVPRSEFEPIDAKWPEEHVGDVGEIIQEYRWRAGIGD